MPAVDRPARSPWPAGDETASTTPDVRWLVQRGEPYALVRLVGALEPPAAESVHGTLLTCLADLPAAVVVDVSQLRVSEPLARAVFTAVASEAAEWPGWVLFYPPSPEAVRGPPNPETVRGLAGKAPVPASLAEVLSDLGAVGAGPHLTANLEPDEDAARRARELVADSCTRWGVPELAGSAGIAITEMVNNVVVHARTPMTVRLALRVGALRVAVRDFSRQLPAFGGLVPVTSIGGRGLLLIDAVARYWGANLLDNGKLVWAVLYAEDEPAEQYPSH